MSRLSITTKNQAQMTVETLYKDLEKPLSERAHHLLHANHHDWKMPTEE